MFTHLTETISNTERWWKNFFLFLMLFFSTSPALVFLFEIDFTVVLFLRYEIHSTIEFSLFQWFLQQWSRSFKYQFNSIGHLYWINFMSTWIFSRSNLSTSLFKPEDDWPKHDIVSIKINFMGLAKNVQNIQIFCSSFHFYDIIRTFSTYKIFRCDTLYE